ncbi:MAG: Fic family protein [Bacteroidales bacterium]|nr:Fic family protein [Bacteroidales bacterium]
MTTEDRILNFLHYHPGSSREEVTIGLNLTENDRTIKRIISNAIEKGLIEVQGKARATKYFLSPKAWLLATVDVEDYFNHEVDEREMQTGFNFDLINNQLPLVNLFTPEELKELDALHKAFTQRIEKISQNAYDKEMERLGIDLSWKSSQIEGNTYSLLETERLLKEKIEAKGKSREEAIMLLNHKEALRFILSEPDYLDPLTLSHIEDIHSLLIQELSVTRNIRSSRVGITGTNYMPLDNEFQIKEAIHDTCDLINSKENVFEKALLALLLISYIQPFEDGNKRTARIVCNALLIANHHIPLSFRSVDSIDYKKALLLFYEQNNISSFKRIFIDQVRFAVNTYF